MKKRQRKYLILIFLSFFLTVKVKAQNNTDSISKVESVYIGTLINKKTKEPLPYANISLLNKNIGCISNENGAYKITIQNPQENDTLVFHYVGYKSKKIAVKDFEPNLIVLLNEETFSLNETFVFASEFNIKSIIKKVVENIDQNYQPISQKSKIFIRNQNVSNVNSLNIEFKKSSFKHLNEKVTDLVTQKMPKKSISYTDFLANIYFSENNSDTLKILPIKIVSLKDKNLTDFSDLEIIFENMFKNTKEKEYWKIKSGIIGTKLELDDDVTADNLDSVKTFHEKNMQLKYYRNKIDTRFKNLLKDKDKWDFLYHPGKYTFNLVSGAKVNDEDVYIVDFKPNKGGVFIGRLYIAINSYAIIKADFNYDKGKLGRDIHMFGIGYTENVFDYSVYFEKINNHYQIKYLAEKTNSDISFDRNISLLKKKQRFFIDKKVNEIKVGFQINTSETLSTELLVMDSELISKLEYDSIKQKKYFQKIYVDQFSDDLWKGFSIIEPTKQMRNYQKNKNKNYE